MKNKYEFGRVLRFIIFNTLLWISVYFALFQQKEWADNILVFTTWIAFIPTILCSIIEEIKLKLRKLGRSVPKEISIPLDVVLIILLVAFGRFGLATLWTLQMSFEASIYDEK